MKRAAQISLVAALIAIFLGFVHAWRSDKPTVVTPPDSAIATAVNADLYALLARGFLRGHLHLDVAPPSELATVANPYDPAQRPPVLYLHDSSYYRGRYYIYFGPAPAVLAFAPWRIVTGNDLPTPYAVFAFASLALLALVALFRALAREFYPAASAWSQSAALLGLGGAAMLIPLVRRPGVYEVAIACGSAAALWGLYCAWRSRNSPRALRWACACGLLFGIAVAARPTFGLGALPALLLMGAPRSGKRFTDQRWWGAAACGAAIVAALLCYNHARFGSALEFGQKYQLSSAEEGAIQHFSARWLGTQAWYYLFAPLGLGGYFPFLRAAETVTAPAGFGGHEYSFGLLTNFPFLWFGVFALAALARKRPLASPAGALLAGALLALGPLLFFFGSCVRYQAEFAPYLALLAALGLLEAERGRKWIGVTGFIAALLTLLIALLASIDMYNPAANLPPRGFDPIGRWLNRPVVAWREAQGRVYGPIEFKFRPGEKPQRREWLLVSRGPGGATESISVERPGPAKLRLIVERTGPQAFKRTVELPAEAADVHTLTASLSSLYPLRRIELASDVSAEDFRAFKVWLCLDWNGKRVLEEPHPAVTWRAAEVWTAADARALPGLDRFSGQLVAAKRTFQQVGSARDFAGVRLRVKLDATLRDRVFPLAVTGHQGRGNFLFVRVIAPDELRFGYDHWGKPALLSPIVKLDAREHHVIDFWMPSILSTEVANPLVVEVDGQPAWSASVPFYPAGAQEIFLVRNPLGGSACEAEFPNAIVESTQRPAQVQR